MNRKRRNLLLVLVVFSLAISVAYPVYAESYNLSLKRGENLISFPLTLQDTAIEDVFSSIVSSIKDIWTYDSTDSVNPWKHYRPGLDDYSSLPEIETGRGYWVDLKYARTLQISGSIVPDNAVLELKKGWNLIGWPYFDSQLITQALCGLTFGQDYTSLITVDNTTNTLQNFYNQPENNDFDSFEPGKGYYIYMLRDKTIAIGIEQPVAPENIEVTTTDTVATLTWDPVTTAGIAGYNLYRSQEPGRNYTRINSDLILDTSYTDDSVDSGAQYYYRIAAVDSYGNESPLSFIVYRFLGAFIGPQGGEVISDDGRVKLIIPPGALDVSTEITILSPVEQYLEHAVPQDQTMICAAKFEPAGLEFNDNIPDDKKVEVFYTLPQAEVPNTAVEIVLYNSANDEILSTVQNSTVAIDGYTVNFNIDHFSTYAALKGMFSQGGAPIGSGVDIPLPDMFTGAFSHSIPLTIPPGRKKMQPNLALTYRSSNPNSWLGVGFSLNPGQITRSTRLGPPSYNDEQDTFYFISEAGSTELVHLADNLYQAKIESGFTKFFKEADSWRVVEKNGMILHFGQTPNSKETSDQGTFSWKLSKALDTNGNFVEYNYTKDQGKSYLDYIDYTGNENIAISAPNRIEFNLESREDISSSYISGSKVSIAKRLSEIQVKQNGELVWRYQLDYAYSPDTERSLLQSVTQYGADGSALPTQEFTYQGN